MTGLSDLLPSLPQAARRRNAEHSVGVEKRDLRPVMFNEDALNQQQRVKCSVRPQARCSQAASLRRARPPARSPRPSALPRPAAVLGRDQARRTNQLAPIPAPRSRARCHFLIAAVIDRGLPLGEQRMDHAIAGLDPELGADAAA
jgi:hypothetical protein